MLNNIVLFPNAREKILNNFKIKTFPIISLDKIPQPTSDLTPKPTPEPMVFDTPKSTKEPTKIPLFKLGKIFMNKTESNDKNA